MTDLDAIARILAEERDFASTNTLRATASSMLEQAFVHPDDTARVRLLLALQNELILRRVYGEVSS